MSKKMITLKSSDGELFEVEEAVALQSRIIADMLAEINCVTKICPLGNVTGKILAKVVDYCKHCVDGDSSSSSSDVDPKKWDATKLMDVDQSTAIDLVLAADYLNIKGLLDLSCQTVANMIKGKTPDQIRALFNIEKDFTPEEEDELRMENQWAFE